MSVAYLAGRLLGWVLAAVLMVMLLAAALAVPAAVVFAMYEAFPRKEIEPRPGEGWLDTVFANQYVIFSARVVLIGLALVLLFGAIYIAVSIFYRIYRREFLHKAGPFEAAIAATADRDLAQVGDVYQEALNEAWEANEELERRLAAALEAMEEGGVPLPVEFEDHPGDENNEP
jgi:hypothetical protein